MPRYEVTVFLALEADTPDEAVEEAAQIVEEMSAGGVYSFSINMDQTPEERDE